MDALLYALLSVIAKWLTKIKPPALAAIILTLLIYIFIKGNSDNIPNQSNDDLGSRVSMLESQVAGFNDIYQTEFENMKEQIESLKEEISNHEKN